jgi:hypothetical protein
MGELLSLGRGGQVLTVPAKRVRIHPRFLGEHCSGTHRLGSWSILTGAASMDAGRIAARTTAPYPA